MVSHGFGQCVGFPDTVLDVAQAPLGFGAGLHVHTFALLLLAAKQSAHFLLHFAGKIPEGALDLVFVHAVFPGTNG